MVNGWGLCNALINSILILFSVGFGCADTKKVSGYCIQTVLLVCSPPCKRPFVQQALAGLLE